MQGYSAGNLGTTDLNGGSVTTAGAGGQTYDNAVVLTANGVLTDQNGKNVTFNSTVNSQTAQSWALTVNTAGNEVFNGIVGGSQALASLSTDANGTVGGQTIFNAAGIASSPTVTTSGAQSYHDAVLLDQNTTLSSSAGGTIRFYSTVDAAAAGSQTLLVRTDGASEFDGPVGGTTPLAGLHVQGYSAGNLGTTDLNGGSVTTAGAGGQTYDNAVVLTANGVLTDQNGKNVTFNSTVNSQTAQSWALTVNTAGNEVFNGIVGGSQALASLSTDANGTVGGQTIFNAAGIASSPTVTTSGEIAITMPCCSIRTLR